MIFGIDVSTYLEELANGAKFYDETGEMILSTLSLKTV